MLVKPRCKNKVTALKRIRSASVSNHLSFARRFCKYHVSDFSERIIGTIADDSCQYLIFLFLLQPHRFFLFFFFYVVACHFVIFAYMCITCKFFFLFLVDLSKNTRYFTLYTVALERNTLYNSLTKSYFLKTFSLSSCTFDFFSFFFRDSLALGEIKYKR